MQSLVFVALGGALGACSRYLISDYVLHHVNQAFPWATLLINTGGSLLMGICYVLILETSLISTELRPLLMVGFLGALTTFSTFSLETLSLLHNGHIMSAAIYISLSVILCISACAAGLWATRMILGYFI